MNLRHVGLKKTFDKFLQQNFIKVMKLLGVLQEGLSMNSKLVEGQEEQCRGLSGFQAG